ncbi:PREDICTED: carnitine O-palmitoyltransferase 1, liver isoform [Ceratosolen solmsi marchali]|uniref:carnitine O-palmitoyltransferase n=1 Tax=Ceratosolen solmsi marchali TaxID=326594 RepID=A0AAJ6VM79_9HYME|nr:PREDICTED: carnitine O-palmitoyltransferase 1, liver isoform [Ceratosolen solmsi marchali]
MDEPRMGVIFTFSITQEGWNIKFNREVFNIIWQSVIRSWKKKCSIIYNKIINRIYPASVESLLQTILIFTTIHLTLRKVSYNLVEKILPYLFSSSHLNDLIGCFIISLFLWLVTIYTIRYVLKLLFMYKGWMYEARGVGKSFSFATKVWMNVTKLFSKWRKPMLYSFQGSLPTLPLPSIEHTTHTYLRSVQPLLHKDNYKRIERLANEFRCGVGIKLQRYLILKSWWSCNYVSDWWEEFVYLRNRSPIMVNSNYYGIDVIHMHQTKVQSARAATAIYSCLLYRRLIERQEIEPIVVRDVVPLCSWQYKRVFNTTRIPGIEIDRIVHFEDSKYIVVYHKGKYFKLQIYFKNRLLLPCEIELQIQSILKDTSKPCQGEEKLAALTAGERSHWAKVRKAYFSNGVNRTSLDAIDQSAFFVALDDVSYEYCALHAEKLDNYSRILLHGKGYDRWFDKSFTLCIGRNGKIGFNAEHAWADSPIMGTLWEFTIYFHVSLFSIYKEDGHTMGTPEFTPPSPIRLQWDFGPDCHKDIETSYLVAEELLKNVDMHIYVHDMYGKGFMKKCSISPDSYIQMALQLAYYRDTNKFSLTYEAASMRLFREGRTETVRSCTIESVAWVKAMELKSSTVDLRYKLLLDATAQHQKNYLDAMCGKGIDRHLFCLYIVSKYLKVESPFLKEVMNETWKLSTSQTPHGQTSKLNLKKFPNCVSAGGGFASVVEDGYGVSYIITGENMIFFHISSKYSSPETNSKRFANQIKRALVDMKDLFLEKKKLQSQANGFR